MLKTAVCDDNTAMLQYLSQCISSGFSENSIPHGISKFSKGSDFIAQHKNVPFDVVFLDIKMPDMSGFEVAKQIRQMSKNTYIIFITTEESLVYDSFDFQPFHFICKGDFMRLKENVGNVVKKLIKYMAAAEPIELQLPYNEKKYVLPSTIIYAKSYKNYIDLTRTQHEVLRVRGNMEYAMRKLPSLMFSRIHNRYIVNMKHITKVDYPNSIVFMDNGDDIEISRAYKKSFGQEYNIFLRSLV